LRLINVMGDGGGRVIALRDGEAKMARDRYRDVLRMISGELGRCGHTSRKLPFMTLCGRSPPPRAQVPVCLPCGPKRETLRVVTVRMIGEPRGLGRGVWKSTPRRSTTRGVSYFDKIASAFAGYETHGKRRRILNPSCSERLVIDPPNSVGAERS